MCRKYGCKEYIRDPRMAYKEREMPLGNTVTRGRVCCMTDD